MPPAEPKVVKTSMMLAVLVGIGMNLALNWKEAIQVAKDYLAATGDKFGGLEWEYDDWTRRTDSHVVVFFKQKE